MTKLKSKKMTKSTFAIVIMAIAMVAMLAFGGTYAYFTANATVNAGNVMTATVQLTGASTAELTVDTKIVPGQEIVADEAISATNGSDVAVWVFAKIEVTAKKGTSDFTAWQYETGTDDEDKVPFIIDGGDFTALGTTYPGVYGVSAATTEDCKIGAITFNSAIAGHSVNENVGTTMGVTVTVKVTFDAIQTSADYDTASEAYKAYIDLGRTAVI